MRNSLPDISGFKTVAEIDTSTICRTGLLTSLSKEMNARPSTALIQGAVTKSICQHRGSTRCSHAKPHSIVFFLPSLLNQLDQRVVQGTRSPLLLFLFGSSKITLYQCPDTKRSDPILHFLTLHTSTAFLKLPPTFTQQNQSPMRLTIQVKFKDAN